MYYRAYRTIELNSGEMVVLPEGIAIRDYLWAALIRATWLRKCEKRQEISPDEAKHIKWFPRPNTYAFYYGSFFKASKKAFRHCRLHSYFDMSLTEVMEIVTPRKKVVEDVPQEYIDKLRRESQKQRRRKSSSPWGAEKRRRKEMAKGHSGGRPKTNPEMVAKAIDDFLIANNGRIPSPADCGRDKAIGYSYKVACDIMGKTREARREYGKKRMGVLKAELDNSTTETLGDGSVSVGPMIEEVPAKSEVAEGEPEATEEGSVEVEEVSDESGAGGSGAIEEELEAAEAEDEEPGATEGIEEVSELEDEEQEPEATEEGSVEVEEVSDESGAGGSGAIEEELEAAEAEDEEPGAAEETEDLDRTDDEAEAESEEPDTTGPEPDVTGDEGDGGEEHTPMSDLVYVEESRSGKNGLKITIHIEDGGIQQLRGAELKFSIAFPK